MVLLIYSPLCVVFQLLVGPIRSRLLLNSLTAKISRMSDDRVLGLFINNCCIFPSDRARTFDDETDRVIGVTVQSHRGFKREETRGEIKPMLPFLLHRRQSLRIVPMECSAKEERREREPLLYSKFLFSLFSSVELSEANNQRE